MIQSSERREDRFAALTGALAEYEALRAEIEWMVGHGFQLQAFALGMAASTFPVSAYLIDNELQPVLVALLLALPFGLALLGLLYFRQHQEIYVLAAYIRDVLRPQVRSLTSNDELWGWEEFKRDKQERISQHGGPLGLWHQRTVLMMRLLMFILPGVLALILAIAVSLDLGWQAFTTTYGMAGPVVLIGFAVLDSLMLLLLSRRFWTEGDFATDVLGSP